MSFLTSVASRRVAVAVPRGLSVATQAPRSFSTSFAAQKTATDSVKDGLKTVDKAVSEKLVDGINVAAAAGTKVKDTAESVVNTNKGAAAGKAEELKGEMKGAAAQAEGKAKGAAEQVKQKL